IISEAVPFKPNIKKISERTNISRNSLIYYLNYLEEAQLLKLLKRDKKGISLLQKPEKIYFDNPNLIHTLSYKDVNVGNERETFFINQVSQKHKVSYSEKSDFLVDEKYTFEVGGKNKTAEQIKDIKNSYLALDNIEYGYENKIPLWMFGFLY
ncbi:MAG: AAA family ATPase, partial [Chlorobi bacterium]|nr:AAA family ATPase [Chlorobiota bacterium]